MTAMINGALSLRTQQQRRSKVRGVKAGIDLSFANSRLGDDGESSVINKLSFSSTIERCSRRISPGRFDDVQAQTT